MKSKILGVIFLGILLMLTAINFSKCNQANGSSTKNSVTQEPIVKYGIITDSFQLTKGVIKPGQVIGEILYLNHIDHVEIDKIVKASNGVFDVKRAKSGRPYTIF